MELMEVPKCISATTGEQGTITKTIDEFFTNAKEYVQNVSKDDKNFNFEMKYVELRHLGRESDDTLCYIVYKEKHVLAGVLQTRTSYNNVQYTFFRDLSFL